MGARKAQLKTEVHLERVGADPIRLTATNRFMIFIGFTECSGL